MMTGSEETESVPLSTLRILGSSVGSAALTTQHVLCKNEKDMHAVVESLRGSPTKRDADRADEKGDKNEYSSGR